MTYDAVDLFAGPGGWSQACKALGLNEIGIEYDASACQTRRAAGHATVEADVRTVDPLDGSPTGLIASPPCQTFSAAGNGAGRAEMDKIVAAIRFGNWHATFKDERTGLILEPLRWILTRHRAGRPYQWIAMEQVPTVGPVWEAYAGLLRTLGYSVWTGVLQAEQHGVPQTRKRRLLLANRSFEVSAPKPTHSRYHPRDPGKFDAGVQKWISMAEALGWPDEVEVVSNYGTGGDASNRGVRKGDEPFATITSKFDRMKVRWPHERPATTVNCDPRIAAPGRDDPAVSGSQYGPDTIRVTTGEAGILQSFPRDYPWKGRLGKQREQIGNAIPPLLAQAVLEVAANALVLRTAA